MDVEANRRRALGVAADVEVQAIEAGSHGRDACVGDLPQHAIEVRHGLAIDGDPNRRDVPRGTLTESWSTSTSCV